MAKRSDLPKKPKGQYYTPREALWPLLEHLKQPGIRFIEPCAGDGRLCVWLEEAGHVCVGAYDIMPALEPRHVIETWDARLLPKVEGATHAITNPPWPMPGMNGEPTLAIIRHMLSLGLVVWVLLPADMMHNHYAAPLLRDHGSMIVSIGRVQWFPGTEHQAMDNCCWYQFTPWPSPNRGGPKFIPKARFAHGKR